MKRQFTQANLMEGGADRDGGGGSFLEDWQILQARHVAELTLLQSGA